MRNSALVLLLVLVLATLATTMAGGKAHDGKSCYRPTIHLLSPVPHPANRLPRGSSEVEEHEPPPHGQDQARQGQSAQGGRGEAEEVVQERQGTEKERAVASGQLPLNANLSLS